MTNIVRHWPSAGTGSMNAAWRRGATTSASKATMFCRIVPILLAILAIVAPAGAQNLPTPFLTGRQKDEMLRQQVGIITGGRGGSYSQLGEQLGTLVEGDGRQPFRVVTILGRGSVRNVFDLINMPGVDFALVQSDVIDAYSGQPEIYNELRKRMRIVATLHREVVHVIARGEITTIKELQNSPVNIDLPGSGTEMTAQNIFRVLGIRPNYETQATSQAVNRLLEGRIDALVYVAGKGVDVLKAIPRDAVRRAGLHVLPIPTREGLGSYLPGAITHADYPNLVPDEDGEIETQAVQAVLVGFAWGPDYPRYQAMVQFVDLFFSRAARLVQPNSGYRTDLWCQASLGGGVGQWQRLPAAEQWLKDHSRVAPRLRRADGAACP